MRHFHDALLLSVLLSTTTLASPQSLEDFGIPAVETDQAAADRMLEVQNPAAVKRVGNEALGQTVTSAETTQDAINTVNQELKASGKMSAGFISTSSGLGVVAVGKGSYNSSTTNPNLKLIEQRHAWIAASLQARVRMLEFLRGLKNEGKEELVKQMTLLDDEEGSVANIEKVSTESISQSISGMICGAVVYEVDDNPEKRTVTVTLVSTPKTQGAVQRDGSSEVTAKTIKEGVDYVLKEIRAGLLPPVGGRTVYCPDTGQMAWVGFGAEVYRKNVDPDVEEALRESAATTAGIRSKNALLGLINDQEVSSFEDLTEEFRSQLKQFDVAIDEDGNETIQKRAETHKSAMALQVKKSAFGAETLGELPPGIVQKHYDSTDGNWAYAVAIYMPEVTAKATELATHMDTYSPLNNRAGGSGFELKPDGSFALDEKGRLIPKSLGRGQVTRDTDL